MTGNHQNPACPQCRHDKVVKSGIVQERQRFKCKSCGYFFTVSKQGKETDPYTVVKALQLYIEGLTFREIERILGVSHVSVRNWVSKHAVSRPQLIDFHPTYSILDHKELVAFVADLDVLKNSGCVITELGDKFMVIRWVKFRKSGFV
jgi:transposase-like protein